jgi:hypothetical protein
MNTLAVWTARLRRAWDALRALLFILLPVVGAVAVTAGTCMLGFAAGVWLVHGVALAALVALGVRWLCIGLGAFGAFAVVHAERNYLHLRYVAA